jgi:hypothetical protein
MKRILCGSQDDVDHALCEVQRYRLHKCENLVGIIDHDVLPVRSQSAVAEVVMLFPLFTVRADACHAQLLLLFFIEFMSLVQRGSLQDHINAVHNSGGLLREPEIWSIFKGVNAAAPDTGAHNKCRICRCLSWGILPASPHA